MKRILLGGAAIVFAGIAATVCFAADHKPARHAAAPAHATVITPAKATTHKVAPKRHVPAKKHAAPVRRTHHSK